MSMMKLEASRNHATLFTVKGAQASGFEADAGGGGRSISLSITTQKETQCLKMQNLAVEN